VLEAFRSFGLEATLRKLRGMFAFALYDLQRRQLHLARDPFGIKPLYYADDGWSLSFASQVKALRTMPGVDCAVETAAQVGFYLYASVPEPFTWYRGIRALPAGHFCTVSATGMGPIKAFVQLADHYDERATFSSKLVSEALLGSVRAHMVSDVPVGAFLSAGIDSSCMLALMRQLTPGTLQTVTLRFAEFIGSGADEGPLAEMVAQRYGSKHHTIEISESDFRSRLDGLLHAMDQPSIDGFNSYLVSQAARQLGLKVCISGLGGDELFMGYDSFRAIPNYLRFGLAARVPLLGTALRQMARVFARIAGLNPKAPAVFELARDWWGAYQLKRGLFMPYELSALLPREVLRDGLERLQQSTPKERLPQASAEARISYLETSRYMRHQLLRDTDWASMAHGLEVRVPLVDVRLHQSLAPHLKRFADGEGKRMMAATPLLPVPEPLLDRPKSGFSTPVAGWLERDPQFDQWRRFAFLKQTRQHWSRRFAVAIAERFMP
jgi:asparagine synthase (glutamine-hydrolysing)